MKKFSLFLSVLLFIVPALAQDAEPEWVMETIGQGIKPAIAVDSEGGIHIAYLTEAIMGNLFYASNASGEWEVESLLEGYFYGPVDIAVAPNDEPVIAFHDHQDSNFQPDKGDAVVIFREDDTWVPVTIQHTGHDGWDNSIAVDTDGFWHTAGIDPSQFGSSDGVEYATNAYDRDTKRFVVEGIGSGAQPYEFATSIAVQADRTTGIAYFDDANQDLVYAERTPGAEGTWTLEIVDSEGDVGRYAALAFDGNGNLHITYFLNEAGNSGVIRYAWRDADGAWAIEDVGTVADAPQGFIGSRKITALDFDTNGDVRIVYGDQSQVVYAQRGDDGWDGQVIAESDRGFGSLVEFALDANNQPHVTFFTVTGTNPLNGDIIYATVAEQN